MKVTFGYFGHVRVDVGWLQAGGQRGRGAIDQDQAQVVEQFLGSILGRRQREQLRILVDEVRVDGAVDKFLIFQHVQQEWNVGLQDRIGMA